MEMNISETSFDLLKYIIAEDVEAYVHLIQYIKKCGKFPKKPADSYVCATVV